MRESVRALVDALGSDSELTLVGGAVRDKVLGREGGDWDLATALLPQEVLRRAKAARLKAIPTGLQHGTVTVLVEGHGFEITTFRGDGPYLDGRHPSSVRLGVALEEDLARRDFTINAMALPLEALDSPDWRDQIVDPFDGLADLEARILRAVGDPLRRFEEDGLRPLRACRFASQLGFEVEPGTLAAIPARLEVARKVAVERALAELTKLLCGAAPGRGMQLVADSGLLDLWLPEVRAMIGCPQNAHHRFPVWEHTLEVLRRAPADPAMRWAALLHDLGKPATRTEDAKGVHFHGHEAHGEALARGILLRLKASRALADEVATLIRHHGTHPKPEWSDAACRRHLRKLAEDGLALDRWAAFRLADQLGKGFGDEPYRTEHASILNRLEALAAARPPLTARDLALDGQALLALAGRKAGPWVGTLQGHLLETVLERPELNSPEDLKERAREWLADNR